MSGACFALIPAAGSGSRAGSIIPKQYLPIAGRPLLLHTIAAFAAVPAIERIVIVVAPDDRRIETLDLDAGRVHVAKVGGTTRAATVANGLASMTDVADDDWVLVHDAARCGVDPEAIAAMIATLAAEPVGGLFAMPVDDTLKRAADDDGRPTVAVTVERAGLWRAQTPQMFRYRLLCDALGATGDASFTDESSAIEAAGHRPRLLVGSPRNFKVTTADDLALMKLCLEASPS